MTKIPKEPAMVRIKHNASIRFLVASICCTITQSNDYENLKQIVFQIRYRSTRPYQEGSHKQDPKHEHKRL